MAKYHDQKQLGEARVYFILQLFIVKGNLGRNLEAGTESETMKEGTPLSILLSLDCLVAFLYPPGSPAQKWYFPQ